MELLIGCLILIGSLLVLFWQGSLLLAALWGAPSVYANSNAITDALKLSGLKKGQLLVDLGCGDARSLIIAAKEFGARGIGIERSPYCVLRARYNVARSGMQSQIKIIWGDFKKGENWLRQADVVYLYLLDNALSSIEKWLYDNIQPKCKVVSLAFKFGDRPALKTSQTKNLGRSATIYLYCK
ncbi:MAG: Methyltransferase domain protein [bacterium ADurb.Bin400]|nr:MAG: Methyltransferase domain protein [bacterium ADurb.Bin400]